MRLFARFSGPAPYVLLLALFIVSPLQARPGDEIPLAPLSNNLVVNNAFTAQQGRMHEAWTKARLGDRTANIDPQKTAGMDEYDVFFYDLDLELDAGTENLSGTVRMEAWVTGPAIASLEMHLMNGSMVVSSVRSGGLDVPYLHDGNLLSIILDRAYAQGEMVAVEVTYSGDPGGNYFGWASHGGSPLIWTLSEPYGARHWWPCKDLNTDKADSVNIRVTVDESLVVASNGTLLEVNSPAAGKSQYVWQERYPIATYLVSLAIHPYAVITDQYVSAAGESMDVMNFVYPEVLETAEAGYAKVVEMLEVFSAAFGEYPFVQEKYGHAQFPWGGGMEHQTCSSMTASNYSDYFIAHELAHQWFGDMITCADFGHIWLNEGFATWSEAYWMEIHAGLAAYHLEMEDARYLGAGTIFVEDPGNFYDIFDYYLSYQKASWVPHMLRHVVGDEDFFSGLAAYRQAYEYSSATTEQFRDIMAQVSGLDLDRFFQQWIYEENYPQYRYSWSTETVPGATRVNVYVEQVQSTGTVFQMPLDIQIQTQFFQENFVVQNTTAGQWYTFHVPGEVMGVELDPNDWILCTKELDMGTSGVAGIQPVHTGILTTTPNPFNPRTVISFAMKHEGPARLDICDLRGRRVMNLLAGNKGAGTHEIGWDGRDESGGRVASGTYLVVLQTGGTTSQHKITMVQ